MQKLLQAGLTTAWVTNRDLIEARWRRDWGSDPFVTSHVVHVGLEKASIVLAEERLLRHYVRSTGLEIAEFFHDVAAINHYMTANLLELGFDGPWDEKLLQDLSSPSFWRGECDAQPLRMCNPLNVGSVSVDVLFVHNIEPFVGP